MKRKQTRFTTEQQILDAIDSANERMVCLMRKSLEMEKSDLPYKDQELAKINQRRHRIEDVRLPKLKNALAAFRTELLIGVTDDPAVVI